MKEAFSFVRTPDFHTLENWNYYFVFYNIYTMYTVFIKNTASDKIHFLYFIKTVFINSTQTLL